MPSRLASRLWPILLASALGCAESPAVNTPPNMFDDGGIGGYADHVIGFTTSGMTKSCSQTGAICGTPPPACASGATDANAVLGAPDNVSFTLGPRDKVEAAFLCSVVIEHGGTTPMPSLQIFSTLDAGARAIVEVSYDGQRYGTLDVLDVPNKTFSLSRSQLTVIRFVRITDQGAGGVHIDAVQGL